jgi:phosphatidylserine decarboxylase
VAQGDAAQAGARFGLIRFGSRVDIYLPPGVVPCVIEGQRMIGAETILADLAAPAEAPPAGVVR